jgi:maltose O-acetyltransferase
VSRSSPPLRRLIPGWPDRRAVRGWWPDRGTWPARAVASPLVPVPLRLAVLRRSGHRFGPGARVRPATLLIGGAVTVGADAFVNEGCFLESGGAPVSLGDQVHLGPGVRILTTSHEIGAHERRAGPGAVAAVTVGDGCWIGAGAMLLPGTTLGPGSVVAAGAVVHGDVPADMLVAGVPARPIRSLR